MEWQGRRQSTNVIDERDAPQESLEMQMFRIEEMLREREYREYMQSQQPPEPMRPMPRQLTPERAQQYLSERSQMLQAPMPSREIPPELQRVLMERMRNTRMRQEERESVQSMHPRQPGARMERSIGELWDGQVRERKQGT